MSTTHPAPTEPVSFADLHLQPALLQALAEKGYHHPTPIQEQTIPLLLEGKDVVGQAQTGTGKTAAFSLPLLQSLDTSRPVLQALVLTPTRELALQVAQALYGYAKQLPHCSILPIYGGDSMQRQLTRLEKGVHVVVATPGRLMDHMRRGSIALDEVRTVVLDEADEMLRMGFLEDVTWILENLPVSRQVALFSATMPSEIKAISKKYLRNPTHVHVKQSTVTKASIDQRYILVSEAQKSEVLQRLLSLEPREATLIFTRTKVGASVLAEKLEAQGIAVQAMHSDLSQAQRQQVLKRLREKRLDVVVATDVAARGLDIHHISHVINYDMPGDAETYVHRIGRTGRVTHSGIAILFVSPREKSTLQHIESYTKQPITKMTVPSLAELAKHRNERLKQKIQTAAQENLSLYQTLVKTWVQETELDASTIAAAALRLLQGEVAAGTAEERDPLLSLLAFSEERDRERAPSRKGKRPYGGFRGKEAPSRRRYSTDRPQRSPRKFRDDR